MKKILINNNNVCTGKKDKENEEASSSKTGKKGEKPKKKTDEKKRKKKVSKKKRDSSSDSSASEKSEDERLPKKKRKSKKKTKKRKRAASSSDTSSSSDSSSSSSTSSAGSSGDAETNMVYNIVGELWQKEKRPAGMKSKEDLKKLKLSTIKDIFEIKMMKEKAERQSNYETMEKDARIPKKKYKKGEDDCTKIFHPARWERTPVVHPKKFWKQIPITRSPVFRNIETDFYGFGGRIADKTLSLLHDRSTPLLLKHFLTSNANIAGKPRKETKKLDEDGLSSIIDFSWESASSLNQIQEAINNYKFALFMIWPADPTGIIMGNLLNKYKWIAGSGDQKTRQIIITNYFNGAMRINANKASNKQVVMSFREHEELMKEAMIKMDVKPEIPLFNREKFHNSNESGGGNQTAKINNRRGNNQQQRRAPPIANGEQCCYAFNALDGKSCRNAPTPTGCKDLQGRSFAHACSVYMPARNKYCLGRHKRKDHR